MVSVIVPNYNHGRFLARRLDSILSQSFVDLELIILDDASTDNSKEIIERYRRQERVTHIIYNEVNSGSAFKQWRTGISLAKGDWVWIAESDDYCSSAFLETLLTGMEGQPGMVLAFAQSYCVTDEGSVNWQSTYDGPALLNGGDFFRQRLLYGCTIFNASMAIFRRDAALRVNEAFTDFRQCGDWYFWIQVSLLGNVFISKELLNYYRRTADSPTSMSYASGVQYIEEIKMFGLLRDEMPLDTDSIKRSVYNRYNSFKKKRQRFEAATVSGILEAVDRFFGGRQAFRWFVWRQDAEKILRKMRLRLQHISGSSKPAKRN